MTSLATLSDPQALREFAREVSAGVERRLSAASVDTGDDGIRSSEELTALLVAGRDVPFDYDRLIEDAKSYR